MIQEEDLKLKYHLGHIRKYFYVIGFIIICAVSIRNILDYKNLEQYAKEHVYREAKILQTYFSSMREVYHDRFTNSQIELNDKTVGLLPAHASLEINTKFNDSSELGITIKNVSDRYRNEKNKAQDFELTAIEYFKKHRTDQEFVQEIVVNNKKYFHYAAPLYIKPYCLQCHGEQQNTVPYIKENYKNGYDYNIGDLRGITSITIDKAAIIKDAKKGMLFRVIMSFVVMCIVLFLLYLVMVKFVKNERKLLRQLIELSTKDPLTNLYNRRYFNEIIQKYIKNVKRNDDYVTFAIVDIDFFKQYNDTYGHKKGDDALQKVALAMAETFNRGGDFCFRLGGEEFGILFSSLNYEESFEILSKFVEKIEKLTIEHQHNINHNNLLTISVGFVVQKGKNITSEDNLYLLADKNLYKAKDTGRDKVIGEIE